MTPFTAKDHTHICPECSEPSVYADPVRRFAVCIGARCPWRSELDADGVPLTGVALVPIAAAPDPRAGWPKLPERFAPKPATPVATVTRKQPALPEPVGPVHLALAGFGLTILFLLVTGVLSAYRGVPWFSTAR